MFFPGKLISLKIFSCLPGGFFCCWGLLLLFFPSAKVLSAPLQHMSVLLLRTPSLALLEVKAGRCVKIRQWNCQGLLAILQYLASTAGCPAGPPAAVLGYMDITLPVPELGGSASLPPPSSVAQRLVCIVCVGVIVLHLCALGYWKLFVERKNISVPAQTRKAGNLAGGFGPASLRTWLLDEGFVGALLQYSLFWMRFFKWSSKSTSFVM